MEGVGVGEAVARLERVDGSTQDRDRRGGVALLEQGVALVVQGGPVSAGRWRRGRLGGRGRRRVGGRRAGLRRGLVGGLLPPLRGVAAGMRVLRPVIVGLAGLLVGAGRGALLAPDPPSPPRATRRTTATAASATGRRRGRGARAARGSGQPPAGHPTDVPDRIDGPPRAPRPRRRPRRGRRGGGRPPRRPRRRWRVGGEQSASTGADKQSGKSHDQASSPHANGHTAKQQEQPADEAPEEPARRPPTRRRPRPPSRRQRPALTGPPSTTRATPCSSRATPPRRCRSCVAPSTRSSRATASPTPTPSTTSARLYASPATPEEAIPILEQRLKYPDQRSTVRAELAKAKAEAGD